MQVRILAAISLLLATAPSFAALGGFPSPPAQAQTIAGPSFTVYQSVNEAGTTVREYAGADGVVFAVSWSGPFLPDLKQLLGPHFDALPQVRGRGPVAVNRPDLVIVSGGHMRAFQGKAWIPSMLPAGVSQTDIQ